MQYGVQYVEKINANLEPWHIELMRFFQTAVNWICHRPSNVYRLGAHAELCRALAFPSLHVYTSVDIGNMCIATCNIRYYALEGSPRGTLVLRQSH